MMNFRNDVDTFMRKYERLTNQHDAGKLIELLDDDAVYWFANDTFHGKRQIFKALVHAFHCLKQKTFKIFDIEWLYTNAHNACCRYKYQWECEIDGLLHKGEGFGTNILIHTSKGWKMLHEHLS